MKKLKVMTILGTRPEIIRLSEVIKKCDKYFDHILVHTGQNWDYTLNQIFFEDLELRVPPPCHLDCLDGCRELLLHGFLHVAVTDVRLFSQRLDVGLELSLVSL